MTNARNVRKGALANQPSKAVGIPILISNVGIVAITIFMIRRRFNES